jgi:hypothetical protein
VREPHEYEVGMDLGEMKIVLRIIRQFLEVVFSEVAELGAHQAAHHPYHQLYGPIVV